MALHKVLYFVLHLGKQEFYHCLKHSNDIYWVESFKYGKSYYIAVHTDCSTSSKTNHIISRKQKHFKEPVK